MSAILLNAGPIIVSIVIATLMGLHIGRGIHKAGVERYGGRILIFSTVINTGIVALMLLLLGAAGLRGALTQSGFHVVDGAVALFLLILPIRALWNYATAPGRIARQSGIKSLGTEEHRTELSAVAEMMGIRTPRMLSSPRHRTPFVFGRSSRAARILIPEMWSAVEANSRQVMLCHELAHIRNGDVGFMTWSSAFLRDLKWLLLLSPAVVLLSLFSRQEYLPQAAALYVACVLILWFLTNTVVRGRELLADSTAALLIDSGRMGRTFDEMLLAPSTYPDRCDADSPTMILRIRNGLMDKAMFSKRAKLWKAIARLAELAIPTHPSVFARLAAIRTRHSADDEDSSVKGQEAFWAGLTLGLLGVLVALGGFWTGKYLLGWEDDEQIVLLSYDCWGSIAPLVAPSIAFFFVLPAWSSLRVNLPTRRHLLSLAKRYLYGLLGASCVSALILLGGWSYVEIKMLLILQAFWICAMLAFGLCVEIVMRSLWLELRCKQRDGILDLVWAFYVCGLGILSIAAYLLLGLILLRNGAIAAGMSTLLGLLFGLVSYVLIAKRSCISRSEQYIVLAPAPLSLRLEGRAFRRWAPFAAWLHILLFALTPAAAVSFVLCAWGSWGTGYPANLMATAVLIASGCLSLVVLDRRWPKRIRENSRRKIGVLLCCQVHLRAIRSPRVEDLLNRLIRGACDRLHTGEGDKTVTTTEVSELTRFALSHQPRACELWDRAREWAVACEVAEGFGPWPGSGPRLSSTHQCLKILQKTGGVQLTDPGRHVRWILGLRTAQGSFRGPWSYRSRWEDTFFAVASLDMLSSNLDGEARAMCLDYARQTLVREGIEKGQMDAFHYCLETADTLHGLDDEMADSAGRWLSLEFDRLLLTHVAHNAGNIYHAVCAYHILEQRGISLFHPERMDLLAARIAAALEAELAALRI